MIKKTIKIKPILKEKQVIVLNIESNNNYNKKINDLSIYLIANHKLYKFISKNHTVCFIIYILK